MSHASNRTGLAIFTQRWFGLLRPGRRGPGTGPQRQPPGQVTAPPGRGVESAAGEASLVIHKNDDGLSERIDAELCAFNDEATGHHDLQPLRVAMWNGNDLLGGLSGSTWGGCGYIDLIWVRSDCRRSGMGTRLLEAGEGEIRRRGCDQVALSTYSFQAPAFYARVGYVECGRRADFPHGHDQILFTKRLGLSARAATALDCFGCSWRDSQAWLETIGS